MLWVLLNHYKFLLAGFVLLVVALFVAASLVERRIRHKALLRSQKFCRKCGGKGKLADGASCPNCKGTGIPAVCPNCGGDGKIDATKRCSYCMGTGVDIM